MKREVVSTFSEERTEETRKDIAGRQRDGARSIVAIPNGNGGCDVSLVTPRFIFICVPFTK